VSMKGGVIDGAGCMNTVLSVIMPPYGNRAMVRVGYLDEKVEG